MELAKQHIFSALLKVALLMLSLTLIHSESYMCPDIPICGCEVEDGKFNVYCLDVDDISTVQFFLHNYFLGRVINELKLQDCSVINLPDDAFTNSSILTFNSSCPFSDIEGNALRTITNLTKVEFSKASFKTIPNGLRNLTSVKTLNIIYGKLTNLSNELMNYNSLTHLKISQCSLEYIAKTAFVYTPRIVYLELSNNNLKYIHEDTFDSLKNLEKIILNENKLLSMDGFLKHLNPEIINVASNELRNVDNIFHEDMWALKIVSLRRNPIGYISPSAFENKLRNLDGLDLMQTDQTSLSPDLLKQCGLLRRLKLNKNKLQFIPKTFFSNTLSLQELDLSYNKISSIQELFSTNSDLRMLILNNNNISAITKAFNNKPMLKGLLLQQNNILGIRNGDFANLTSLQTLNLNRNKIELVDTNSFAGLKSLENLHLANGGFRTFNYSIRNLPELRNLVSKTGSLEYILDNELVGLPKLTSINLAYNNLKSINGAFRKLKSLTSLNIQRNKLQTISRDTFPEEMKFQTIYFSDNPWDCDCRILWFVEWLNRTKLNNLGNRGKCATPPQLRSIFVHDLTVQNLTDWHLHCPYPCSCKCQPEGRGFHIVSNCSRQRLRDIPRDHPAHLGMLDVSNNLLQNISNLGKNEDHLYSLNLTNNLIDDFDTELPSTLRILKLEGNKMSRFPSCLRNLSLVQVTLSRNPWICDCKTIEFRNWLRTFENLITDVNETRCGDIPENGVLRNRVVVLLQDSELCPPKIAFYLGVSLETLGAVLTCAFVVFACIRYKFHLKTWLYAHGITWIKRKDEDTNRIYDALISYCAEERDFVLNVLISGLETQKPIFFLCVPERDLIGGGNLISDKLTAIANCKRIVIVMSRNYMADESCMEFFRNAFATNEKDILRRLIIIKYGKLTPENETDSTLKTVLKSSTALSWPQKMFWEQLRFAMPEKKETDKCQHCNQYPETKRNENIMSFY